MPFLPIPTALLFVLFHTAVAAYDPLIADPATPDPDHPPRAAGITITNNGQRMSGILYTANGPGPHPTVVLLHGIPGNEKNLDIAQAVRRAGFNVLFFHYRGSWGSEGNYALLQLADDAGAVLSWLRAPRNASRHRVDVKRLSTLGHSMGGFASLAIGARDPELTCVGAMSPANLGVMAAGIASGDPAMLSFLRAADRMFMLAGFDGSTMRRELGSVDPTLIDTSTFGPGLRGKSVFLVVGREDVVIPPQLHFDPVAAAYAKVPGLVLEEHRIRGDHSFSSSRIQLTRLVLDWLQRDCR
jgi:pimeloyl-ACP methyl ester carboxylesterase